MWFTSVLADLRGSVLGDTLRGEGIPPWAV
jgi:hypothetical protein